MFKHLVFKPGLCHSKGGEGKAFHVPNQSALFSFAPLPSLESLAGDA